MIAGVAAANEIFVMPTVGLREEDKDYAILFVIPRNAEGITVVEAGARAAWLTQWLTCGAGIPGCMHGGGSPDAKLVIRAAARWDDYIDYACKLAGVKKKDFPVK